MTTIIGITVDVGCAAERGTPPRSAIDDAAPRMPGVELAPFRAGTPDSSRPMVGSSPCSDVSLDPPRDGLPAPGFQEVCSSAWDLIGRG
jgi:hypothetical protein